MPYLHMSVFLIVISNDGNPLFITCPMLEWGPSLLSGAQKTQFQAWDKLRIQGRDWKVRHAMHVTVHVVHMRCS